MMMSDKVNSYDSKGMLEAGRQGGPQILDMPLLSLLQDFSPPLTSCPLLPISLAPTLQLAPLDFQTLRHPCLMISVRSENEIKLKKGCHPTVNCAYASVLTYLANQSRSLKRCSEKDLVV